MIHTTPKPDLSRKVQKQTLGERLKAKGKRETSSPLFPGRTSSSPAPFRLPPDSTLSQRCSEQSAPKPQYQLRRYQIELIQEVMTSWARANRRVMLQLPTGAGKTVLFSAIAHEFLNHDMGVLVLAHRQELITQAAEKLESVSDLPVGIIKAGFPSNPNRRVQVASVQTLIRRQHFPDAGLIIFDEAHHSCSQSYLKIFQAYPNAYILGVTATPTRTDGQGFKLLYDDLICGQSVTWLMKQGYLSKYRLFAPAAQVKTEGVKITAGDFNQRELVEAINTSLVMGDLINTWRKYAEGKRTVVFTVDVKHSKAIAAAYTEAGIPAEHLDGETSERKRNAILDRFRRGEILILSNCGIVTEGFDVPAIEVVQCVRPTQSLVLWLQMIGRALRPSEGKNFAQVIDHTENWKYHGLPDDDREWSLDPISLNTLRFSQQCPECDHIFKPLHHELKPHRHLDAATFQLQPIYKATCPNCQTLMEFEMGTGGNGSARTLSKDEQTEVEEVTLEASLEHQAIVDQLLATREKKGYKAGWVYYQLLEHKSIKAFGLGDWRYIASKLGYKSRWACHRWQEVQSMEPALTQHDSIEPKFPLVSHLSFEDRADVIR